MNQLSPELQQALEHQRLLIVWGDVPFELLPSVIGERAVMINRLLAEAAQLPAISIRLSVTPPLPIVSLDPTDRIEREFRASNRALRVVTSARDVPAPHQHTLIKLAGDLNSRTGLVLSREEVQRLPGNADKHYLLDLVRQIVEGGAVLLVKDLARAGTKPARSEDTFQAWWSIIRPACGSASILAAGDPAAAWPDGLTYLGTVQDVMSVAFANFKAPLPKMEPAMPLDVPTPKPVTEASSGAVAPAEQVEVDDDVTGRDKVVVLPGDAGSAVVSSVQTLRVDAAVPDQVFVNRIFDLAVAVRQMTSPVLAIKDLAHVESGDVQTTWEAHTPLINLRLEVDAPDCEIEGKRSILFRLVRGQDSPLFYFHLKPRRVGELSIVVTVYQEDYWLGSARVSTLAAEQATHPAGKVQLTVASQALWLDCEVRVYDRSAAGYKVEMTLNGEQTINGWMAADVASFVLTGDPRDDGQRLFEMLFADPNLREAWGEARGQSRQRRIRLRVDPPELRGLPWELMRDDDDLLAAQADTPFSRYLATDQPWGGVIAARPIRVLVVISNPIDLQTKYNLPQADMKLEEKTLREAFDPHPQPLSPLGRGEYASPSPLQGEGRGEGVSLTFLSPPITLARVEEELQKGYHILHFIGHGAFNVKQQQAALYLQNDDGTAQRVLDDDFAGLVNRLPAPPQLIVLAACQSAQQAQTDAFSSLGPQLVQIGIPAVVAMQDNVTVLTARQFGAKFYRRLLEHGVVDRAMNEARSLLITNGRFDAAVPVLFMRLRDGRLWSEAPRAATAPALLEPPQPVGRASLSTEERESLERQLQSARANLRLIEERKSEYVLETDVPLQLVKEERRLKDRIAELEQNLRGAQGGSEG